MRACFVRCSLFVISNLLLVSCGGENTDTPNTVATSAPISTPTSIPTPVITPTPAITPTPINSPEYSDISLGSTAFKDTGNLYYRLPLKYTCDEKNGGLSPSLFWSGVPAATQSIVLTMHSFENNTRIPHFSVFNISPNKTSLTEGDLSVGVIAQGDMTSEQFIANDEAYIAPCAAGAGIETSYFFTLYALSQNLTLENTVSQAEIIEAVEDITLDSFVLTTTHVRFDSESIANDLHVPSYVPSTCVEKTAHFNEYPRMHASVTCDENANQMNIVSHISDGLKTYESEQQVQVGINSWIGRLSIVSAAGGEIRIVPSYLTGVNNNISCDGTGKLGISVDGQIILPYYKQTGDAGGDTCGPTDGTNYASRDTVVLGEVDQCYGHAPNGEGYHLHGAPICLMDIHDPSKPIAYMSDGIPLYFGQAGGTIEDTLHAQTANQVTDTNFGAGIYEHLDFRPSDVKNGTNPLNACNAYDIHADGAVSGYVYYTTKDAPYAIGCFMGEVLDNPKSVSVTRSSLASARQGWDGQELGQALDVSVLANYYGELNGKTYNVTEAYVNASTSFLTTGDVAQVFWRVLSEGDDGFNTSTSCFHFVYRANKLVTTNDQQETVCTRSKIPQQTIDFHSSAMLIENNTQNKTQFKFEAWGDNWFAAYLGDELIVEDSVPITTERSFNAETANFTANYPLTLNVILKDFKENDTGLEYIGTDRQQMGDGGFIMQITDTQTNQIVAVSNNEWKCLVIHEAPLNKTCENEVNPVAGIGACDYSSLAEPNGWKGVSFNDSTWPNAVEYSSEQVAPKDGYDNILWDESAKFIWGDDLETNNTLLCRMTISAP